MKVEDLPIAETAKKIILDSGINILYPPQEDAVRAGVLEGKNLVLASPTASGKTLIAELCSLKHVLEKKRKVLYLSPLRALANEKYAEFKKYTVLKKKDGRRVSVSISTGDYDSSAPWLGRFDIIICTNEKLDSLLRHGIRWLDEVSLVIADEIHLINDAGRGPTLEVVLARLTQMNPEIQLLALSATIRNAEEIAEWLKATAVTTEWRPVLLKEGVILRDKALFKDGSSMKVEKTTKKPLLNFVSNMTRQGGQALIFAATRRNAARLAKSTSDVVDSVLTKKTKRALERVARNILASGERTRISEDLAECVQRGVAFHHAGLGGAHRTILEEAFRDRKIKVIAATPTLAFGVNLPARMVIVSDYRRYEPGYGNYPIPVLDYKQMAGRAGRPKYDKVGEALLISKNEIEQDFLLQNYVLAEPERIWSKLAVERILRSHVLATVALNFVQTEQGLYDFFTKTFYAYQYDSEAIDVVIEKILKFLFKEGMIKKEDENILATRFGRRISELYIDPLSGVTIRNALCKRPTKPTNISLFHMIAHTPDIFPKLRPYQNEIETLSTFFENFEEEFIFEAPAEWDRILYENFLGEVKIACVLTDWIEESTEDEIIGRFRVQPGDLYRLVQNTQWLLYASHELALLLGERDISTPLANLTERTKHGVTSELLPFVRLKGIGRVRARILHSSGIKNIKDLKSASIDRLSSLPYIGTRLAKSVKAQVGGFVKLRDWRKKDSREQQDLARF